jgi:hypothetical protein
MVQFSGFYKFKGYLEAYIKESFWWIFLKARLVGCLQQQQCENGNPVENLETDQGVSKDTSLSRKVCSIK